MNPSVFLFSSALVFLSDLLSVNGRPLDSSPLWSLALQATAESTTVSSVQVVELGDDVVEDNSEDDFFPQSANFDSLNEIPKDPKPFKPTGEEATQTPSTPSPLPATEQSTDQQFAQLGNVEVVPDLPVFDRNILLELRRKSSSIRNV
ncbi:hypothetical protein RvY_14862 [Ramazzottius varieornatus]|uniref:Uncharacterized protein n=1 Tax=Ramazzottius varieornatus TaxID=947166 RepID=A0A1D1VSV2_RAMVA|nr:hypothetical protein RvY_14862 [Ramazzottius varieornatus]